MNDSERAPMTGLLEFRLPGSKSIADGLSQNCSHSSNAILHIESSVAERGLGWSLGKSVLGIGDFSDAGDLPLLVFDVYHRSL
jgi:hypothetical protein